MKQVTGNSLRIPDRCNTKAQSQSVINPDFFKIDGGRLFFLQNRDILMSFWPVFGDQWLTNGQNRRREMKSPKTRFQVVFRLFGLFWRFLREKSEIDGLAEKSTKQAKKVKIHLKTRFWRFHFSDFCTLCTNLTLLLTRACWLDRDAEKIDGRTPSFFVTSFFVAAAVRE